MATPKHYTSTDMLEGAFQFRKAELWNVMQDHNIFGVKLDSGEIAYCIVMGNAGTYYGLGMYRGAKGFSSFLRMIDPPKDEIDAMANALTYDVINCNFSQASEMNFGLKEPVRAFSKKFELPIPRQKGWPEFVRYQPFRNMHPVDNEVDGNNISMALHAGAWLGKQLKKHTLEELGFIHDDYPTEDGGMEIPLLIDEGFYKFHIEKTILPAAEDCLYPTPEYQGEVSLEAISKKKGNGIVEVGTVYIPLSIGHNPDNVAPFIIPVLFKETGFVNAVMCNAPYDENPYQLLNELVDCLTDGGQRKPASIVCTDELTQNLLRDFCKKAGIMMAKTKKSKDFIQATYYIFASMGGGF